MALLGEDARKIPGSYKFGTGTITFVSSATAYAKPDQTEYGREVYIHGGLSDKTCIYKLTSKYKAGDRVQFQYVPATRPERGCKWAVINLSKLGDNSAPTTKVGGNSALIKTTTTTVGNGDVVDWSSDDGKGASSDTNSKSFVYTGLNGSVHQVTGRVDYNGIAFAYIHLDPPYFGRAFMADQSVIGNFTDDNGTFSLAKAFPVGTRVVCDLQPQKERKGCKYFAKNVVIDYPKSGSVSSKNSKQDDDKQGSETSHSMYSPPRLPMTKQEFSPSPTKNLPFAAVAAGMSFNHPSFPDIENLRHRASSMQLSSKSTSEMAMQTDPTMENQLLEKIFADEEIFHLICTRHPEIMYRYMRSANATGK